MINKKGKLIVIDGSDGSGKATQARLLVDRLRSEGRKVRSLDFPQYKKNFFGKFIGECLRGKYGDFLSLDAHITAVLYAADRFEAKKKIENWLSEGLTVILDRYVSANQIHQGGKIRSAAKRAEFLKWLDKMEYGVFGIPRPDKVIFLDVPVPVSLKLLRADGKRLDGAEKNMLHLERSRRAALWLSKRYGWTRIICTRRGEMRSKEEIYKETYAHI